MGYIYITTLYWSQRQNLTRNVTTCPEGDSWSACCMMRIISSEENHSPTEQDTGGRPPSGSFIAPLYIPDEDEMRWRTDSTTGTSVHEAFICNWHLQYSALPSQQLSGQWFPTQFYTPVRVDRCNINPQISGMTCTSVEVVKMYFERRSFLRQHR